MLSGKFVLRLDPKIHKALKEEAKARGESLNSLCLQKIQNKAQPEMEIIPEVVKEFTPLGILLFGSTARGEATERSDIDLLIILPETQSISRQLYLQWDKKFRAFEKYSPQFVHLPKTDEVIGSIWLEASMDGEVLYDPQQALKETLLRIRVHIAEGYYLRKNSHGHAYWIRQEPHEK